MLCRAMATVFLLVAGPIHAQDYDWENDPEAHRQHPEYVDRMNAVLPSCVQQDVGFVSEILVNYSLYLRGLLSDTILLDRQIGDAAFNMTPYCYLATQQAVGPFFNNAMARANGLNFPFTLPYDDRGGQTGPVIPVFPIPGDPKPPITYPPDGSVVCDNRSCFVP